MVDISVKDVVKSFDLEKKILDGITFQVDTGERVGLLGKNGAGKTTLFRLLTGELEPDSGQIVIATGRRVGLISQIPVYPAGYTVEDVLDSAFERMQALKAEMDELTDRMAKGESDNAMLRRYDHLTASFEALGGYDTATAKNKVANGLSIGADMRQKLFDQLSGGEKTRVNLARLILEDTDILLLDEPTNHLDLQATEWLEEYLRKFHGTVVVISHDRYFLDQTVNRIFEIENHKLTIYEGNYSFYATERKVRREAEFRKFEKQQKEIRRQEDMIRRFKQRGTEKLAKRAASREKRLAAMDVMDRPEADHGRLKLNFHENFQSGKDVLLLENLSKKFAYDPGEGVLSGGGGRQLFQHVDLDVKRGERICIVGANGIGKTTLLKMILGENSCTTGRIRIGHNVQFGYYDQGQQLLNGSNTVIGELQDAYRLYNDTEMRNILGRFLFRGESVFLQISSLSGGEKARLALLKLMLSGANVLILDEPTNHLDIESKEVFEEALLDFPGTSIIVSHDRYFLNRIPTRIVELTENGMDSYLGTYDYYVEKKQAQIQSGKKYMDELSSREKAQMDAPQSALQDSAKDTPEGMSSLSAAEQRKLKKEQEAKDRRIRRQKESLEADIASLENDISCLEAELCLEENMKDHVKLTALSEELADKKGELELKYEEWLILQE